MAIGVLIVDDHPIAREGLRRILERDPACRVLGEAASGREAIAQARRLRPDVVLMDLSLPDLDGISVTAAMHRELPDTEVVVLTDVLNPTSVTQALQGEGSVSTKSAWLPSQRYSAAPSSARPFLLGADDDGEGLVPQHQGETEPTLVVADAQQAILSPEESLALGQTSTRSLPCGQ